MNQNKKYRVVAGPYSLRELIAKEKLPQLLQVTKGFYAPTEEATISEGQIMVAYFVKRIKVVRAEARGEEFNIPLNSSMKFSLLSNEGIKPYYKSVLELANASTMPEAVACKGVVLDKHGQVIRPGTVMFPRIKKGMMNKLKMGGQKSFEFASTRGEKIKVPIDSEASFSAHLADTKLYISEILQNFSLPIEVQCMTNAKNFRGTSFLDELTLLETREEASLIGGFKHTSEEEAERMGKYPFDLPLDLLVEVVCVQSQDDSEQYNMYEEVRNVYESKQSRVASYKRLVSNCNMHDRAQTELYSTIREEMCEHVTKVDMPENVYEDIVAYGSVGLEQVESKPKPTGPVLPPKGLKPDSDYVQLTANPGRPAPAKGNLRPPTLPKQKPAPPDYEPLQLPTHTPEKAYERIGNADQPAIPQPTGDTVAKSIGKMLPPRNLANQRALNDHQAMGDLTNRQKLTHEDKMAPPPMTKKPPGVLPKGKKTPPPPLPRTTSQLEMPDNPQLPSISSSKESTAAAPPPPAPPPPPPLNFSAKKPPQPKATNKPPTATHPPGKTSQLDARKPVQIPPVKLVQPLFGDKPAVALKKHVMPQVPEKPQGIAGYPSRTPSLKQTAGNRPALPNGNHPHPQVEAGHTEKSPSSAAKQMKEQAMEKPTVASTGPIGKPQHQMPQQQPQVSTSPLRQSSPSQTATPRTATQNTEEKNIEFLKTLDCNEILSLVSAMKLDQYLDQFMQEHVDGELLACMEENELVELGITSSLHRKRFVKVIEGKTSAQLYMEEGNPYGSLPRKS